MTFDGPTAMVAKIPKPVLKAGKLLLRPACNGRFAVLDKVIVLGQPALTWVWACAVYVLFCCNAAHDGL